MRWVWRVAVLLTLVFMGLAGLGAAYERVESRRDFTAAPPPGRMIDVGGHRLHVWCVGQGKPVVVFDSGLGGTSFDWYPVLLGVAGFTTACAYDRAGMGYSDIGPSPRTSRRIAGELAELVRRSETKLPIILVGWSDGGLYARQYASEHESQIAGLVLVDSAHEDQAAKFAEAGFPTDLPAWGRFVSAAAAVGVMRLAGRPLGPQPQTEPEAVRRFVQATVYRPGRYDVMYDEGSHFSQTADEVRASRRVLSVPVVVLSSGRSPIPHITAPLQRDLLQLSARSCQIVAADSDHMILSRAPEAVVRATRVAIDAWRTESEPHCD